MPIMNWDTLYLNRAPIDWYSKRQNSVETLTVGSEFMVLKIKMAVETIKGLHYKLHGYSH